jgi:hypothetical protein
MGNLAKIFILICGVLFFSNIVYLLVKRKINERNSLFWLVGSFIIFAISAVPDLLEIVSKFMGIDYPPALLFLLSTLVLLYILLSQNMQLSRMTEQIKELSQQIAIIKHDMSLIDPSCQIRDGDKNAKHDQRLF